MHKGVLERKAKENQMASETAATQQPSVKLFPVLLNKNYVPIGHYEIVGYLKEAVKRKDAAGNWRVVEPEEFIKGEMKPHTSPGVGFGEYTCPSTGRKFNAKIWAGTQIAVPVEEAKFLIAKKIAERADDIAA
jgi:hypothetical protein